MSNCYLKIKGMDKIELLIISSIITAAVLSISLLVLNAYEIENMTFKNSSIFDLPEQDVWLSILATEALFFSGFIFFLDHLLGWILIAGWASKANPLALLGILLAYSAISIPIIGTRKIFSKKKKIIYSYFSATQFSGLTFVMWAVSNSS